MIAILPGRPLFGVRVEGFRLDLLNKPSSELIQAPRSELIQRAIARTTPGDVAAFSAAMRARVESARALRGRP